MVSEVIHWVGLKVSHRDALNMLPVTEYDHNIRPFPALSLKDQSLVHWVCLFMPMICIHCACILHLYYLQMIQTCFVMVLKMEKCINDELAQISQWWKINELSLNVKKTNHMLFTKSRIGEIRRTEYLSTINWIGRTIFPIYPENISRNRNDTYKARNYLNQDGLLALYHTFI